MGRPATSKNGTTTAPGAASAAWHIPSEGQPGPPWDHGDMDPAGQPWWRHDLFPLEATEPDQVLRWWHADRRNANKSGSGHPDCIVVSRWSDELGKYVDCTSRIKLEGLNVDTLKRRLGTGNYKVTAYSWLQHGTTGRRYTEMCRGTMLAIDAELLDLDADEPEDEADEPDVEQDGERPLTPADARVELERLALERHRLELEAQANIQREKWAREDAERAERQERDRQDRADRDARDAAERDREREHRRELARLQSSHASAPQPTPDPVTQAITAGLAAFVSKQVPRLLEGVVGGGAATAKGKMAAVGEKALELGDTLVMNVLGPIAEGWATKNGWIAPKDDAPPQAKDEEEASE